MVLGYFPWSGRGPRSGCKETDDQAWPSVHNHKHIGGRGLGLVVTTARMRSQDTVMAHCSRAPPRPRNYPGLVPPRPALRPRVSQGGTLASKHPSILQRAGCRVQARTRRAWDSVNILGLEAEAEYPARGWKTQGPPGGGVGALGTFVKIHNPMICMFQF